MAEIQHVGEFLKDFRDLILQGKQSDVTLVVESKSFSCHKLILASRSEYFNALLFGKMKEAEESTIELKDISSKAFHPILVYIYTGLINLSNMKMELLFDVFKIAHQFGFRSLMKSLSGYLESVLSVSNVCLIFEQALFYEQRSLIDACGNYIDDNAHAILKDGAIVKLSASTLETIMLRDTFRVEQIDDFNALYVWIQRNENAQKLDIQKLLHFVRLRDISSKDLIKVVRPTKLFPDEDILDAIEVQLSRDLVQKLRKNRKSKAKRVTTAKSFAC